MIGIGPEAAGQERWLVTKLEGHERHPVPRDPIDLRAVLARIDRDLAENAKLLAEVRKLGHEGDKFNAERHKFDRDWWLGPLTIVGAILAAVIARLPEILHAIRWGIPQ